MADEVPAEAPIPEPPPPEPVQEAPAPVETPAPTPTEPETPTAQISASEPLPPEPEPIAPTPAPEPPQAATSVSATPAPTHSVRDLLVKARATIQDRKRKKLDKILEALSAKGKITNDEVEKLLRVSDATATRYLSTLEKEGKIKQEGKTGTGVMYAKV